jgi:hypothetical protein
VAKDFAFCDLIAYELLYALREHGFTAVKVRWLDGSWCTANDQKVKGYRLKIVWACAPV